MKKIFIYTLPALALAVASCADSYEGDFKMEKPESVEHAEHLASLAPLNSVIDRTENPNFKLGLGVSSQDYASKGLTYSIALTNFDMVTDASAFAYASIADEAGAISVNRITDMVIPESPVVAGGAMLAYNALPKAYLEEVISPNLIIGDLEKGSFSVADFEGDTMGTTYSMSNGSVAAVAANPSGDAGQVLQIGSAETKAKNSYAILTLTLPDGLTAGNLQTVVFELYCPDTNSQKRNFVAIVNGIRKNYTGDTPDKRGCPLETWMKFTLDLTEVELTEEVKNATELELSFGPNVNNSYYFIDNISLSWSTGEPDKYVEKTEEEKAEALAENFGAWADAVMAPCARSISDYVVLANPMSDAAPYVLRSAESEAVLDEEGTIVNDMSGMFFFNDYMGDNFIKTVTDCLLKSYKASEGAGDPNFFVSESGLLGNPDKTQSLLNQISAWTASGAKIDGIAVDMNNLENSAESRQAVTALLGALANTGKLIRLDNLSVANSDADFYGFLVGEYFRIIKGEKRAGIIFANTSDLWKNNARTDAYEAVMNAISKK